MGLVRWLAGIVQDETGAASAARITFIMTLVFTFYLIAKDATTWTVPDKAYALLSAVLVGQIAWAGGNRVAAHLAPSVAAVSGLFSKVADRWSSSERMDTRAG